jgi:hypothetical protein
MPELLVDVLRPSVCMSMLATDYYWRRAGEALAAADRSAISEYFVSIAMVYQSLAAGEGELHRRFPNIPPRYIDR